MELVWERTMLMLRFVAWVEASSSILWDMVPVKKIIRSGLPSLFRRPPAGLVNTLAWHRYV